MKLFKAAFFAFVLISVLLSIGTAAFSKKEDKVRYKSGEIIIKFKDGVSPSRLGKIRRNIPIKAKRAFPEVGAELYGIPPTVSVDQAVRQYEKSGLVEYAEPNYIWRESVILNDPLFNKQWGLNNSGQLIMPGVIGVADADLDAPEAWARSTGTNSVVVAMIDTGVQRLHPDLVNNIWKNPGETGAGKANGRDDDRNGYVDDFYGWDFYNNNNTVYDSPDVDDHGTHVAGIIGAAGNNKIGVSGVNWRVKIMPLKFLGADGGTTEDAIAAISYALNKGANVINASWGGGSAFSNALFETVRAANREGVLFVAAAGNGNFDLVGDNNDALPEYPASFDLPNVIAVGASTEDDMPAYFSNRGAVSVDVFAPGTNILSTIPTLTGSNYDFFDGTSMATPYVTGLVALIKSKYPLLNRAQMQRSIFNSVDQKSAYAGLVSSSGRINAASALRNIEPRVTFPNGGQTLLKGGRYKITWSRQGAPALPYQVQLGRKQSAVNGGFEKGFPSDTVFAGKKRWLTTSVDKYAGSFSARAGAVGHAQSSVMSIGRVFSKGTFFNFKYKVSSEEYADFLDLYIDGKWVAGWSGEIPWSDFSYYLSAGQHTIQWVYSKDGTLSEGSDTAWVDNILTAQPSYYLSWSGIATTIRGASYKSWPIPANQPSGAYKIRVRGVDGAKRTAWDYGDAFFIIR